MAYTEHDLRAGFGFTMPDGETTATLLTYGRTPFEWLVLFSNSSSGVLTVEFILDHLNQAVQGKSL